MDQEPVDSTAFRRGNSTAGYLCFGVVAHACVFALWVRAYLDVGRFIESPANIQLAVRGPLGQLVYLGIAGWLAISICMVIFARRRGWARSPWDVLLIFVPGIVVLAGVAVLLLESHAFGVLMHLGSFQNLVVEDEFSMLALLGPSIAAAFALAALQLSLLAVCASARSIAISARRIGGRQGLVGGFGFLVFGACAAMLQANR